MSYSIFIKCHLNNTDPLWKYFILNIKDKALGSILHILTSVSVWGKNYFSYFVGETSMTQGG